MEDLIGVYGILDRDHWPEAPFQLLDGGVEIRSVSYTHLTLPTKA